MSQLIGTLRAPSGFDLMISEKPPRAFKEKRENGILQMYFYSALQDVCFLVIILVIITITTFHE